MKSSLSKSKALKMSPFANIHRKTEGPMSAIEPSEINFIYFISESIMLYSALANRIGLKYPVKEVDYLPDEAHKSCLMAVA